MHPHYKKLRHPHYKKLREEMLPNWFKLAEDMFPVSIPEMAKWTELSDIVKVLDRVGGQCGKINHMFFPSGGGMDLTGAKLSVERGCVELETDGLTYIGKPKELTFFSINQDPDWICFRLDLNELAPSGVYENISEESIKEAVMEVKPGVYDAWDGGYRSNQEELREDARVVTRFFRGSLVIFCKVSIYNLVQDKQFDAYNAYHEKFTTEEFYRFLKRFAQEAQEVKPNKEQPVF